MEQSALSTTPARVVSVSPVELDAPHRAFPLEVRVSAPALGDRLPVIVFSHGFGNSMDGYAPLAHHWAAHGFVVVQPTFLDSRRLGSSGDPTKVGDIWRGRVTDVKRVLDQLDLVEASVPGLRGRVDRSRIAAVGHSFGAQTSGLLLGARVIRPDGTLDEDMRDPRINVGILLCAGGRGGDDLSAFTKEHLPYLNQSYSGLTTPTLVVAGDKDVSPLTVRGPDWFADAYALSPGAQWLATLFGGEHMLGGISGYLVTETTDENPERVAAVQRLTTAYLRRAFFSDEHAWAAARLVLEDGPSPLGRVDGK